MATGSILQTTDRWILRIKDREDDEGIDVEEGRVIWGSWIVGEIVIGCPLMMIELNNFEYVENTKKYRRGLDSIWMC